MFGKHRTRGQSTPGTEPDLPITPMLDLSFQLMFFFVATFRPAPTEAMIALTLPKVDGGQNNTPPPTSLMPEEDEELAVQVYAADNGAPNRIVAALKTGNVELGGDTSALLKFLKDQLAGRGGKAPKLKFELAENVNYQFVVKLIDEAKRNGFDRVSPTLIGGGKG